MARRKNEQEPTPLVTIPCGCQYATAPAHVLGPTIPCEEHRTMTCARCGGVAYVSPIGLVCGKCSFGKSKSEGEGE